MACALRLSQLIDEHNAKNPDAPALERKYLRPRKIARDRTALPLGRSSRSPVHARAASRIRKRSPARRRSHARSRLLPDAERQIQAADHAAAIARSRQLRHLDQQIREMARPQGRRDGHHHLHRIRRLRTALRRQPRRRRPHRRQRRRQRKSPEVELRARLRPESQSHHPRRGHSRIADQAAHRKIRLDERPQPADLGHRRQRIVGSPLRQDQSRRSHLHHGLAADHQGIRRRLDLRFKRQRRVARIRHRSRLPRPPPRSAARACRNSRNTRSSRSCSKAAR